MKFIALAACIFAIVVDKTFCSSTSFSPFPTFSFSHLLELHGKIIAALLCGFFILFECKWNEIKYLALDLFRNLHRDFYASLAMPLPLSPPSPFSVRVRLLLNKLTDTRKHTQTHTHSHTYTYTDTMWSPGRVVGSSSCHENCMEI